MNIEEWTTAFALQFGVQQLVAIRWVDGEQEFYLRMKEDLCSVGLGNLLEVNDVTMLLLAEFNKRGELQGVIVR
jgi:hypothetical protein